MLPAKQSEQRVYFYAELMRFLPQMPTEVLEVVSNFACDGIDDRIGGLVDIRIFKWNGGRIVQMADEDNALVHYLGFGQKWEKWVRLSDPDAVQPFCSLVLEHTELREYDSVILDHEVNHGNHPDVPRLATDLKFLGLTDEQVKKFLSRIDVANYPGTIFNSVCLWTRGKTQNLALQRRIFFREVLPDKLIPVPDDEKTNQPSSETAAVLPCVVEQDAKQ
eukprot:TRINITY_DN6684_c0_g1_i2.p1 TRINITY_DN6684_c0_g1~~TRINITY_DN6684_c0_g1_i2.p1  ORF type:complete len:220 (-),score=47.93 TRINITY_DN6684_c0_g1_i2:72-731(-)